MAERWRTLKAISYPADETSLKLVRAAGGLSKLSAEEKARVKIKVVPAGKWCDDVPKESQAWLLADGSIERVTEAEAATPKRKGAA